MKRLRARAEAVAREKQRLRIERIVAELEAGVPGVAVEATASAVVLSGAALARRWLSDPALRFAGTMSK